MKAEVLRTLRALDYDESGQDMIEYALIAALIGFGTMAAAQNLTAGVVAFFGNVGTVLGALL